MPTDRFVRPSTLGLILGLGAILTLGACGRGAKVSVPIDGPPITLGTSPAIDVDNVHGSVRVIVDRSVRAPTVKATIKRSGRGGPSRAEAEQSTTVTAESSEQDGRPILRVASATTWEPRDAVAVALTIRLPDCGGVLVRNSGGSVALRGVGGAVQVENGHDGLPGGRIEVRTGAPLTDPVALVTTDGGIAYQVAPGSTGAFDLVSEDGVCRWIVEGASMTNFVAGTSRSSATINGGANPIVIRTGKGNVLVMVREGAEDVRAKRLSR